jgi:hypothetical protein
MMGSLMNTAAQKFVVFFGLFFLSIPAVAEDFDATHYPVAAESLERLSMIVSVGNRVKERKLHITTRHLRFPAQRKRFLGIMAEENSANTKITAEKNLVTGEKKFFLDIEGEVRNSSKPEAFTLMMFDNNRSYILPLNEISIAERFTPKRWEQRCIPPGGCFLVVTGGERLQTYTWRGELPITVVQDFAERGSKADDRLIFWVGDTTNNSEKNLSKISDGDRLLFRHQLKAMMNAFEVIPKYSG